MKVLQILVLIFGLTIFVNAQTAVLNGTIFDLENKPIPRVKIIAFGTKDEKLETISSFSGVYRINLQKGNYTLEFYADGFIKARFENYKIDLEENSKLDVTLVVGKPTIFWLPDSPNLPKKVIEKSIKPKLKNNKLRGKIKINK